MRRAAIALGALLLFVGCGHEPRRPGATPSATVDPEIRSLRAQLAQARAERDAALARLHAVLQHKSVVRVVVREPAAAPRPSDSPQPATRVFTNLTTTSVKP